MDIKELKEAIKGLPDNAEVMISVDGEYCYGKSLHISVSEDKEESRAHLYGSTSYRTWSQEHNLKENDKNICIYRKVPLYLH